MFENSFFIKAKTEAISVDSIVCKFSSLSLFLPPPVFWPLLISSEFINQIAVPPKFVHYIASPNFNFSFYIPLYYYHYIYLLLSLNSVSQSVQWTNLNFGSSRVMFPRRKSRVCLSAIFPGRGIYFLRPHISECLLVAIPLLTWITTCLRIVFVLQLFLSHCHFALVFYP